MYYSTMLKHPLLVCGPWVVVRNVEGAPDPCEDVYMCTGSKATTTHLAVAHGSAGRHAQAMRQLPSSSTSSVYRETTNYSYVPHRNQCPQCATLTAAISICAALGHPSSGNLQQTVGDTYI